MKEEKEKLWDEKVKENAKGEWKSHTEDAGTRGHLEEDIESVSKVYLFFNFFGLVNVYDCLRERERERESERERERESMRVRKEETY